MERPWYQSFNWALVAAAVAISALGVLSIHSAGLRNPAGANEWTKQVGYVVAGIALMGGFAALDYTKLQRYAVALYVANFVLLALVMRGGHSALGAMRWISLGPFGTFQPSEPAKLIVAIAVATLLAKKATIEPREIFMTIGAVALPALLILRQPDLGTTLVVFAILTAALFFGVTQMWHFGVYAGCTVLAAAFTVGTNIVLKPFQRDRLLVFLHPESDPLGAGYNLAQSKIAVGSGELFGKGLHHGTQTQLHFVPENSRDFIFTVVGEEFGHLGALGLVSLYVVLLGSALRAVVAARDRFGVLLAVGLVAMLAFHIVVNIGMTIGIMPITGIPLPFMSYGGSAVLTDYIALGILLNIDLQRDKLIF